MAETNIITGVNPYTILGASLGNALRPLETLGQGRVALAQLENQRAYQDRMVGEARQFQVAEDQRLRAERRADIDEERLKELRLKHASLGGTDSNSLAEVELSREIGQLAEQRATESRARQNAQNLAYELGRAEKLDEKSARMTARDLNIPDWESSDLGVLKPLIAQKKVEEQARLADIGSREMARLGAEHPALEGLKAELGQLERERSAANLSIDPSPVMNEGLTPEDSAQIYAAVAQSPSVTSIIQDPNKLALIAQGRTSEAVKGMKERDAEALAMAISAEVAPLVQAANQRNAFKHAQSVDMWVAKARNLPYRLQELDRRMASVYSRAAQIHPGLTAALSALTPEDLASTPAPMPMGGSEQLGPQVPAGFQYQEPPPPLPDVGMAQPQGRQVEGLIPSLWRTGKEGFGYIANDPLLTGGMSDVASGVERGASGIGNLFQSGKTALFGGTIPPQLDAGMTTGAGSPLEAIYGAGKVVMSPFSMIGNAMSDAATALTGTVPTSQGRINPYLK